MDRRSALQPYRGSIAASAATLVVAVLLSIAFWRLGSNGHPLAPALAAGGLPLGLAAGILLVVAAATVAIHISVTAPSPSVSVEEPLLAAPRVPAIRRDSPFIVVLGVTPKSGASTLACGLALLLATQGRIAKEPDRRLRPLCLVRSDDVPSGISLDSQALEAYLRAQSSAVDDDVVDLAGRHPEGIEFLAMGREKPSASQLRQLLPVLRDHYDAIIMDIPADDRWLATVSAELADAVFLMWAPRTEDGTLQRWVDRLWGLGLEGKTILTTGRRRAADPSLPKHASQFVLEIPEDRAIRDRGDNDMAWAVANSSAAGRQLRQAARNLLPDLFPQGDEAW
jgi:Mrp family chromosome partitioning ATPase